MHDTHISQQKLSKKENCVSPKNDDEKKRETVDTSVTGRSDWRSSQI
jgi:hypothetical protein